MHEISLVRNIFSTLENEFSEDELRKIKTINVKTGVLSNIEPILMQSTFEAVTATDSPSVLRRQISHRNPADSDIL